MKALTLSAALLGLGLTSASAQEAVPLTYELFNMTWVVTEFEGQSPMKVALPMIWFEADKARGTLPCGQDWSAVAHLSDLPAYRITEAMPLGKPTPCEDSANDDAFIKALELVTRVDTTPEGLGFFAEDGRRVILAVAGG